MGRNYIVCVKSNEDGNTYCYDEERRKWIVVNESDIDVHQVPKDVLLMAFESTLAKNKPE